MFKLGQRGQMTVYVEKDNVEPLLRFAEDHPIASASDITNAALRFYFTHTVHGVDGRLRPLKIGETLMPVEDHLREVFTELLQEVQAQRRIPWTEEQRRKLRSQNGDGKQ